jgi:alpha,alpha-trehalose phosphorylase
MIEPGVFTVEPWAIVEPALRLDWLAEAESIFALSNGHFGLRGNLDEGEPHETPGSYLNGFFESYPLPYAERTYGDPKEGQSIVNVTNGKVLRLLVDDEPFDVRYGELRRHERRLDLRAGVLEREVEWVSAAGQAVSIRSTRLVSFVQRAVAAVSFEVSPIDAPARIVIQSSLVANEPLPDTQGDPRAAAALRSPLISEYHRHHDLKVSLGHRTRSSELRMAAALDHLYECPAETVCETDCEPDLARVTFGTEISPGQTLRVIKLLGYGWSSVRSMPALRDQVDAALSAARQTGWEGLLAEQRAFLDTIWNNADVEIEGDPELQQAVRFAIFQVVQAAARAEQRAIPAKGLTGRGYDGHSFWDTEAFTLPVLTYTLPNAARDALLWRHSTLDIARERARELRLDGATFAWRTVRGEECSGYWPAGTAGFHINAAVADAVRRYVAATGDTEFEQGAGLELLVETARLWRSIGHHDAEGSFRIDGVTGPDEYTALVDNNVYTNLMAARNLRVAAAVATRYPDRACELGVDQKEIERWRRAADSMVVPFDDELGVTQQSEEFTRYRRWDFERTSPEDYPLLLHYPYYDLYSSQVIKQADLVFALYRCGDCFTPEQKRRDFDYYEQITVRDSSLSASIQAIVAAEVGHLDLAYDYFRETALIDLRNLAGNTKDGLHLAALSGALQVAVAGFGGLRDYGERLNFAPRLPEPLTMIRFRIVCLNRHIRLKITRDQACYELLEGDPITILHHGEEITLTRDGAQACSCPPLPEMRPVEPPPGRPPDELGVGQNGGNS